LFEEVGFGQDKEKREEGKKKRKRKLTGCGWSILRWGTLHFWGIAVPIHVSIANARNMALWI